MMALVTDRKITVQDATSALCGAWPNFSVKPMTDFYIPNVVSYSDYYPFGMQMPQRNDAVNSYRYKHQGQESDSEIYGEGNSYAYTYRMSDARLGRFWSIDPLSRKYPFYSPYSFSGNRLIDAVELEGLEPAEYALKFDNGSEIVFNLVDSEDIDEQIKTTSLPNGNTLIWTEVGYNAVYSYQQKTSVPNLVEQQFEIRTTLIRNKQTHLVATEYDSDGNFVSQQSFSHVSENGVLLENSVENIYPQRELAGAALEVMVLDIAILKAAKYIRSRKLAQQGYQGSKLLKLEQKFNRFEKHYNDHVIRGREWGGVITRGSYYKRATKLANSEIKGSVEGFTTKEGTVFRYNRRTNEFLTKKSDGTIETFYRPKQGRKYWNSQIEKYGGK